MRNNIYVIKKSNALTAAAVSLAFTAVCVGVLAIPKVSIEGAKNGISYSLGILIPSLFPFMFLSNFAVEYGISKKLGKLLSPFTEKVLYLPGEAGVTVLLSFIGGFPVGAVGINALYSQGKITEKQAQRMLLFCVNSGPAFLISVVGTELYGSELVGVILLFSQITANLLIGMILGLFARKKEPLQKAASTFEKNNSFSAAFINSAKSACVSTVNLCALVVLFSSFGAIMLNVLKIENGSLGSIVLKTIFEVTDGCSILSKNRIAFFITAAAVGWSGLCVHFQIYSSAEKININKIIFMLSRVICGIISAALAYLSTFIIAFDTEVFSNISETSQVFSSTTICGSIALFISCVLFLISMKTMFFTGEKIYPDDR